MSEPEPKETLPGDASAVVDISAIRDRLPDTAAVAASPSGKRPSRVRRAAIGTFEELLGSVYGGRGALPNLTAGELAAMQTAKRPEPDEVQRLLGLAAADRTLDRTRLLMLFAMERLYASPLQGPTRAFVGAVLRGHPVFRAPSLLSLLACDPAAPEVDDAARTLTARVHESLAWPDGGRALNKTEMVKCRANSVACLLLWAWETNGVSLERVLRCLYANLWAPAGRRQRSERQRLKALMATRDGAVVAVAYELLDKLALESLYEAGAARKSEERATSRAMKAEAALADSQGQLGSSLDKAHSLEEELRNEQRERELEASHFRDDYQKLRGRLLQRLKEEVSLLDEGLSALNREPPKVHVMQDHANRAIDNLRREMERLRGEE